MIAYQQAAGGEPANLEIGIESLGGNSLGARAIRSKLAELHEVLYGVKVAEDSPDVEEAFQLFVEVWERKRLTGSGSSDFDEYECDVSDSLYFEGLVDDAWTYNRWGHSQISGQAWDYRNRIDRSDPNHVARTWVVVLAYLLSDYRYLYF